jgi:Zn-dependent M28 family amino/carboxypeptidase
MKYAKISQMKYRLSLLLISIVWFTSACQQDKPSGEQKLSKQEKPQQQVPVFEADSAYLYVQEQLQFGPRVPGSKAQLACADYFMNYFGDLNLKVQKQSFKARTFDNQVLTGYNIIASYKPDRQKRILLCAHWDSRPFADHDPDPSKHRQAIDGANDGASGVGVLMEVARQLSMHDAAVGIDIVLFDLEDYGQHADEKPMVGSENTWGLGSQYWAKNLHQPGYQAQYGILLDMVGAKGAVFAKEFYSRSYASNIVDKVWKVAAEIGYANYFVDQEGGYVLDDHVFINKFASIPTIDIIHYDQGSGSGFFPHWHTVEDNLDKIDPQSLKAVGQTLLELIYREK